MIGEREEVGLEAVSLGFDAGVVDEILVDGVGVDVDGVGFDGVDVNGVDVRGVGLGINLHLQYFLLDTYVHISRL